MKDNVASLMCYLVGWITGIVFLVVEPYKQNRAIRFHAWQSIIFFGAVSVVQILLSVVLWNMVSSLTMLDLYLWVSRIFSLFVLVAWIFLMVQAYNGKKFMIPIIGNIAEKQANA